MTIKSVIVGAIVMTLIISSVSNVFATGIRGDSREGAPAEEHECFINGYDSGFAGKYDKDRARECVEHRDQYNELWANGCGDSTRTEAECAELINNPVEIEGFKVLKVENDATCNDAGKEDGKAGVFNKNMSVGCMEFGDYDYWFQTVCERNSTESSCELLHEEKKYYCPKNPDVAGCAEFLQNATNKKPEPPYCASPNASAVCASYQDNPERYCLGYDSPRCKEIGDLCDEEGFVRPEYPYCTTN